MTSQIVSFHCILKDRLGHVISSSFNQNVSTDDSPSGELRGFSRGMKNLKVGERRQIFVGAEEAYGFYDPQKIAEVWKEELPAHESVSVGDIVIMAIKDDAKKSHRVISVAGDRITLDSNHPLAGQDLIFEIEAVDVRDEESEESDESLVAGEGTPPGRLGSGLGSGATKGAEAAPHITVGSGRHLLH